MSVEKQGNLCRHIVSLYNFGAIVLCHQNIIYQIISMLYKVLHSSKCWKKAGAIPYVILF